ncbi:amidohydrolase [Natronocalculus amylovorans]|uniref:5-methylthioadenosine/S-adenosylhomocysteine deaminase n=1 Tax=Natronocalculus amylovorans TaxID=2917812 RepID=A0AAE3FUS0_9EURY|nr:amidohydrolase [Natronocalculus amylovorans]MCL9815957.1 amidohydrolase [Natronocalculus amylovorans]
MDTYCLSGGLVLTPELDVISANVVVDRDSGTIESISPDASAPEMIDISGCLVTPGLVNGHCHGAMTLLRGYADDKPLDAWLREDIWPVEAELTPEDIRVGTELAAVEMIRSGVTAFADMYFAVDEVASVVDTAGLRARLGHGVVTVAKNEADAWDDLEESFDVAASLSGRADGRIQTAVMPHSLTTVGEAYLQAVADWLSEADAEIGLHLHANETTDEVAPIVTERNMRPIEYASELGLLGENTFLAHGVHLDATEIELLAETDTRVVHCPASNMKLASGIAPIQELIDAGITVGLGTDGAASNNDLDVFDEMRDAAMIGKLATGNAEAVAAASAVQMATSWGAEAIGLPGGQLREGGVADLAVIDFDAPHLTPAHDYVSHLAYAARGSDVRHTICDGQFLMQDGALQTLAEASILDEAADAAVSLVDRATN